MGTGHLFIGQIEMGTGHLFIGIDLKNKLLIGEHPASHR